MVVVVIWLCVEEEEDDEEEEEEDGRDGAGVMVIESCRAKGICACA